MTTNRRHFLSCVTALAFGSGSSVSAALSFATEASSHPEASQPTRNSLLAGVGTALRRYDVKPASGELAERQVLDLPSDIFYACLHPSRHMVYVIGSNADTPGRRGPAQHYLATLRINPKDGTLTLVAPPRSLPAFANHVTADPKGSMLTLACHAPSRVLQFALAPDGMPERLVSDWGESEVGIFAHQTAFTPNGRTLIVCARGNDAAGGRPEDPGRLAWFAATDNTLVQSGSILLESGLGPRNLDCHPRRPWCYVGMERGNRLAMYAWEGDALVRRQMVSTLAYPDRQAPRQRVGAVLVHPEGQAVYAVNRADRLRGPGGEAVFAGGENAIAVFAIDPATGAPRLLQHIDTEGIEPRSIALEASGRWLVAGNQTAFRGEFGGEERDVPASIALYAVATDGTLVRRARWPVPGNGLRWVGFIG